jgi:hypothetical protein
VLEKLRRSLLLGFKGGGSDFLGISMGRLLGLQLLAIPNEDRRTLALNHFRLDVGRLGGELAFKSLGARDNELGGGSPVVERGA